MNDLIEKKKIVLFGASGHGKVVADIVEQEGKAEILGFIDTHKRARDLVFGYPILGPESELPRLVGELGIAGGIVSIGDNWVRSQFTLKVKSLCPGFAFYTAVHPKAAVSRGVVLGEGSVVMAGASINADASIGAGSIVNTNASVDHDCELGDFVHVAPGASLGGVVKVDEYTMIGIGAAVSHLVQIGKHSVIGAGAAVVSDLPQLIVAAGVPARVIRERQIGDKYL